MFQVYFSATAIDQLKRLDKPIAQRILDYIGHRREVYTRPGG